MDSESLRVSIAHLKGCLKHTTKDRIRREYEKAIQFEQRKLEIARRKEAKNDENLITL